MRRALVWFVWALDTRLDGLPLWIYLVAAILAVLTMYLADRVGAI